MERRGRVLRHAALVGAAAGLVGTAFVWALFANASERVVRLIATMSPRALAVSALLLLAACGGGPAVRGSNDLPVRRVVLYRNGVGYFERSGAFAGQELEFGVRQNDVGDFLSSLTAIERTPGGVRSVSFEVPEPPATPAAAPVQPSPYPCAYPGTPQPAPTPPPEADAEEARMDVRLLFDDDARHDLTVAYVVAAPIWRPSYRVVLDEHGKVLLQAWAVVQNTSGEDWRNVRLSLTTGAPIAFQSDLGTAVTPVRPRVTDTGETISAVPESQTTYAQAPPPPPAAQAGYGGPPSDGDELLADRESGRDASRGGGRRARPASGAAPAPAAMPRPSRRSAPTMEAPAFTTEALRQSVRTMAAVAELGEGVTSYDLDHRVTIPDGGSTMVAILSTLVAGEEVDLFAPDDGVPLSMTHPFRVVRIVNGTGAMLERGPISVLGRGSFLGQGVLETLPRDATSFVPFAVDRTVAVESNVQMGEAEGRLVRISHGNVTVERFSQRTTVYKARNGGAAAVKVYVRHARIAGAELSAPGVNLETTDATALVPIQVPAHGDAEVSVVDRTPVQRTVEFVSDFAAEAVALYLSGPAVDAAQGPALQRALALRTQLVDAQTRAQTASTERDELQNASQETRDNLEAIRTVASAADLRQRLVRRLADLDANIAALTRTIVDAQTSLSELRVRLNEAIQDVTLDVPRPAAAR